MIDLLRVAQQHVTTGIPLTLVDETGYRYPVQVVDGIAAGTAWFRLRFLGADYQGQDVWLTVTAVPCQYQYLANEADDGYVFNTGHDDPDPLDFTDGDEAEIDAGGAVILDMDGGTFTVEPGQ